MVSRFSKRENAGKLFNVIVVSMNLQRYQQLFREREKRDRERQGKERCRGESERKRNVREKEKDREGRQNAGPTEVGERKTEGYRGKRDPSFLDSFPTLPDHDPIIKSFGTYVHTYVH